MRMALEPEALDERERLRRDEQGDRPPRAATLHRGSEIGDRGRLALFPRYLIKRSDNYHLHAETVILARKLQPQGNQLVE
jgi:hypothetical protein